MRSSIMKIATTRIHRHGYTRLPLICRDFEDKYGEPLSPLVAVGAMIEGGLCLKDDEITFSKALK